MNIKKSMYIIAVLMLYIPEVYSMHCLTRQLPRTHYRVNPLMAHHALQRRNFGPGDDVFPLFMLVGAPALILFVGAPLALCATYKGVRFVEKEVRYMRYKNDAYDYVKKCSTDNTLVAFNKQSLKKIDNEEGGRYAFLSEMNKRYDQLCLVEALEVKKLLTFKEKNNESAHHAQMVDAAFWQRRHIYEAVCTIEKDMPNYQVEQEQRLARALDLRVVPLIVKESVAKDIKEQSLNHLIANIKEKHQGLCDGRKQLTGKE